MAENTLQTITLTFLPFEVELLKEHVAKAKADGKFLIMSRDEESRWIGGAVHLLEMILAKPRKGKSL